jgi:GNAT superfamily N-acetyltransferase
MVLREATDQDAPILVRLMHVAFEEYLGRLDPPSAAHTETTDTVRARLRVGSAVVALIDDEAVGFAFYQPQETHLYFSRLSVVPKYRNRGIGRALIGYVETRALEAGFQGVRLGVRVPLAHLRARYERLGYNVTTYVAHGGHTEPTYVLMEKSVLRDP